MQLPHRMAACLAVLLALTVGCSTGGETTTIAEAEAEIEELSGSIVDAVDLDVERETPLGSRSRCEAATGPGASNRLSLAGPLPDTDDPVGTSAGLLLDAGYEVEESDELGEGVFGRRDAIRITVIVDEPTDQLMLDAVTGCRPLEDG